MLTLIRSNDPPPLLSPIHEIAPWRDASDAICARIYSQGDERQIDWPSVGLFSFRPGESIVHVWPAAADQLPPVEAVFDRHVRPLILQRAGYQVLHGSAVSGRHGIVAFCGRSGAGKSTLAAMLATELVRQVADDAVVVDARTTPPAVNPAGASLARIVLLERVESTRGSRMQPEISGVTGAAALTAVLAHAKVFDIESAGDSLVADYAALVNCVPVTRLRFQHDAARIPALIAFVRSALPELQP